MADLILYGMPTLLMVAYAIMMARRQEYLLAILCATIGALFPIGDRLGGQWRCLLPLVVGGPGWFALLTYRGLRRVKKHRQAMVERFQGRDVELGRCPRCYQDGRPLNPSIAGGPTCIYCGFDPTKES